MALKIVRFLIHSSICLAFTIGGIAAAQTGDQIEILIDDGDPGYVETSADNAWATWNNGDAIGNSYRYLSHYSEGRIRKGTARWTTIIPEMGGYEVSVHFRQTENRTTDADYVIVDGNGVTHKFVIDQKHSPTGWYPLGVFNWDQGQPASVLLDGTDDNQSDEADAVRWRKGFSPTIPPDESDPEPEPEPIPEPDPPVLPTILPLLLESKE